MRIRGPPVAERPARFRGRSSAYLPGLLSDFTSCSAGGSFFHAAGADRPGYLVVIGSNLNFWPPITALTIASVWGSANTATPCRNLALTAAPSAAIVALA